MLKEWLTVPLELSTVTVISSANSCLAFCGGTTSNFPPVTAKVVKSVNLFIESWVEFYRLALVLKRSINYMQYSTKKVFLPHHEISTMTVFFFKTNSQLYWPNRDVQKQWQGHTCETFLRVYWERANNPEITHQNGRRKKTAKLRLVWKRDKNNCWTFEKKFH